MATERTTDLILRAQVDQAVAPLAQVTERLKTLIGVLNQQQEAAKSGNSSLSEYTRSLRGVEAAQGELLKTATALLALNDRQATVDARNATVASRREARDTFAAANPEGPERTAAQERELAKLNKALASSERLAINAGAAYERASAQFERLGIITREMTQEQRTAALEQAKTDTALSLQRAAEAVKAGQAQSDTLIATLRAAGVEKQVAAERAANAKAYQAEQNRLEQAVRSVWEAEEAGAATARQALERFTEQVVKVQAQARSAYANASAQGAALRVPVPSRAPTVAETVNAALATPSSASAGLGGLEAMQSQVAKVEATLTSGRAAVRSYADELRTLDTVSREIVRQSKIVDSFQKQEEATRKAVSAFQAAVAELRVLEAAAAKATPENLSEVTSAIAAKNRQIGSVEGGTGLAAGARAAQEALAVEREAMDAVGLSTRHTSEAIFGLTQLALYTSGQRTAALAAEKAAIDASADAIISRAAKVSAASRAAAPGAAEAVAAVSGPGRDGGVRDTAAAVATLDAAVKSSTLTVQTYNRTMDQVFAVQRQIASDAGLIDSFTAQSAAVTKATAAFTEARNELMRIGAEAKAGTASLVDLQRAENALNAAAANLSKQATDQERIGAQLKARKIDTANLVVETNKLVASATRLEAVQNRAKGGQAGLLGLSPYQLQNLSFQVNDVITQLSLGQGVMRTLASQGGQIFQVFETSVSSIKTMLLYAVPVGLALGLVALSLSRVAETASAQRAFAAALAGTVDGATRSTKALVDLQREVERTGVDFADAGRGIGAFLNVGLDDARIRQFTASARNMSQAFGVPFADAVKVLEKIPSASIDELEKLLLEYHALTPELAKYLELQRQGGSIDLARGTAADALSQRLAAAREAGVGPLAESFIALKNAFHDLEDALGSSEFLRLLVDAMKAITEGATAAVKALSDLGKAKNSGDYGTKEYIRDLLVSTAPLGSTIVAFNRMLERNKPEVALKAATEAAADLQSRLETAQGKLASLLAASTNGGKSFAILQLQGVVEGLERSLDAAIKKRDALVAAPSAAPSASAPGAPTRGAADIALSYTGKTLPELGGLISGANTTAIVNAWCAAFANAALEKAGLTGSGSNVATSFETWGKAVANAAEIQKNDILVQARGHSSGEPGGHVGFATGAPNKVGPNGAILVEMVSGNYGGRVTRSWEDASTIDIRRAAPAGLAAGVGPRETQARNEIEQAALQRKLDAEVNTALIGNSQARIDQDNKQADLEATRVKQEADHVRGTAVENEKSIALRASLDKTFRDHQKAVRDKEAAEIKQRADSAARALDDAVANADPTNVQAKMKAAANKSIAALDTINTLITQGVTHIDGMPIEQFRQQVLKLRDEAVNIAALEADKATVEAAVKERDTKVATIMADLAAGRATLQQAFDGIAAVVKEFGPKIQQALAVSNADLAKRTQTPGVTAQLAANARIDPTDAAAFKTLDSRALAAINDAITIRNTKEKEYNTLVVEGQMTQSDANIASQRAYAEARPRIEGLIAAFKVQIDLQLKLGQISQETYDKLASEASKAAAAAGDLTKSQKELAKSIDNLVVNSATKGFDSIATAVGKAVAGTGSWLGVIRSVRDAFLTFTADVLKGLAEMIIKQQLFNLVQGQGGTSGGGLLSTLYRGAAGLIGGGGGAAAAVPVFGGLYHEGGTVGAFSMSRRIDPAMFVGAPRMHGGGEVMGLSSGEVPAILKAGERVRTEAQARQDDANNAKPGGGGPTAIRNVLVIGDAEVAAAMAGPPGEAVTLSHLKRNVPAIRQLLGVGRN